MCALTMNGEYWKINIISKYENTFCFIYNVQRKLSNCKLKQNM